MARNYDRPWKERIRESRLRNNRLSLARQRAKARLVGRYREDFDRLYEEEKAKVIGND